jgi:hypothetical protein
MQRPFRLIRSRALSAVLFLVLGPSAACANSWIGVNAEWGTPSLWSTGKVPQLSDTGEDATAICDGTRIPTVSTAKFAQAHTLVVRRGCKVRADGGTLRVFDSIELGTDGYGVLEIRNGGDVGYTVPTTNALFIVAGKFDSRGDIIVENGLLRAHRLKVGSTGEGRLTVLADGLVQVGTLNVGDGFNSEGRVLLDGGALEAHFAGDQPSVNPLEFGGRDSGARASMRLNNGATLKVTRLPGPQFAPFIMGEEGDDSTRILQIGSGEANPGELKISGISTHAAGFSEIIFNHSNPRYVVGYPIRTVDAIPEIQRGVLRIRGGGVTRFDSDLIYNYRMPTRVEAGGLAVTSRISASTVSVFDGAWIGGEGSVETLVLEPGAELRPGEVRAASMQIGTLNRGPNLTVKAGARLQMQLGPSASVADRVRLGPGGLSKDVEPLQVRFSDAPEGRPVPGTRYLLIEGDLSGFGPDDFSHTYTGTLPRFFGVFSIESDGLYFTVATPPGEAASHDLTVPIEGPTQVAPGELVEYRIRATNLGPDGAISALVEAETSGLIDVAWTCVAQAPDRCERAAGTGNFAILADIGNGREIVVSVSGRAPSAGATVSATARIASHPLSVDPRPDNNHATLSTAVAPPALPTSTSMYFHSFTATPTEIGPGEFAYLEAIVVNDGPDHAANARIVFDIPEDLRVVEWSCTSLGGECSVTGGEGTPVNTVVSIPSLNGIVTIGVHVQSAQNGSPTTVIDARIEAAAGTIDDPLDNVVSVRIGMGSTDFRDGFE